MSRQAAVSSSSQQHYPIQANMTAYQYKEKIKNFFVYCLRVHHEAADTAARQDGLVPIRVYD